MSGALGSAPPSTLMTGTTTQIMIDLADVIVRGDNEGQASARSSKMMLNVLMFAIGCGAAALLFMRLVRKGRQDNSPPQKEERRTRSGAIG
jgi:uncharacterized membrane protein YoaK (UPF0700 family)